MPAGEAKPDMVSMPPYLVSKKGQKVSKVGV